MLTRFGSLNMNHLKVNVLISLRLRICACFSAKKSINSLNICLDIWVYMVLSLTSKYKVSGCGEVVINAQKKWLLIQVSNFTPEEDFSLIKTLKTRNLSWTTGCAGISMTIHSLMVIYLDILISLND